MEPTLYLFITLLSRKVGSFNSHKLKSEKSNKALKHCQLRKIANLLRYVEMCVVLFFISRLSFQQLPMVLKNSSEYFIGFTVSHRFVFLVGNIIIVTLFAQSGHFSWNDSEKRKISEPDMYLEFLKNSNMCQKIHGFNQKKMSVKVENRIKGRRIIDGSTVKSSEKESKNNGDADDNGMKMEERQGMKTEMGMEVKEHRRCQSEIAMVGGVINHDKDGRAMQRCESEIEKGNRRNIEFEKEKMMGKYSCLLYPEDGMSNDEFRRTVEAFIARRQELRKNELEKFYS